MRQFFVIVLYVLFSFNGFSQIMGDGETYLTIERINPTFRGGGMAAFYDYINSEFDYSKVKANGNMVAVFTINEEGAIKNIKVTQFLDIESATEIIRVLKKAPKWEPAKRNAKPISVDITLPLSFNSNKNRAVDESAVPAVETTNSKNENVDSSKAKENNDAASQQKTQTGGLSKFREFIAKNYKYPDVSGLKGITAVKFTINEDGTLSDFVIEKNLGYGTAEELIRVLKLTGKKWTPAVKDGKPIKSTFTLPISIDIPQD